MKRRDPEDERWRVSLARMLLCVAIIFYLAMLSAVSVRSGISVNAPGFIFLGSLAGLAAFAALAINRMRRLSIAAMGLAGLFGFVVIIIGASQSPLPLPALNTPPHLIEAVVILVTLSSLGIPIVALLITWPIRHRDAVAIDSRSDVTRDS